MSTNTYVFRKSSTIGGVNGIYNQPNSSSWSTTSDRRIKKNIEDNTTGLEAIKQIQVKNFEYRTEDEIVDFDNAGSAVVHKEGIQLGVIAQEIEKVLSPALEIFIVSVPEVDV